MSYEPTPGPLPGEQWRPSNGCVGEAFLADWCGRCALGGPDSANRASMGSSEPRPCPIIGASFFGEAVEWRRVAGEVMCIAWVARQGAS